jgi:hypothetical protein
MLFLKDSNFCFIKMLSHLSLFEDEDILTHNLKIFKLYALSNFSNFSQTSRNIADSKLGNAVNRNNWKFFPTILPNSDFSLEFNTFLEQLYLSLETLNAANLKVKDIKSTNGIIPVPAANITYVPSSLLSERFNPTP